MRLLLLNFQAFLIFDELLLFVLFLAWIGPWRFWIFLQMFFKFCEERISTVAEASYWGSGDTTCLLLGLLFGFITICIVLGFVARKMGGAGGA